MCQDKFTEIVALNRFKIPLSKTVISIFFDENTM